MRDRFTRFADPAQAGRVRWRPRAVTLASAALLAGGLATVSAPAALALPASASTTTAITSVTPGRPPAGHPFWLSVSVSAVTNGTPSGSVSVSDGGGHGCTVTLAGGAGSCVMAEPAGGRYVLTARYAGVANTFAPSQSIGAAVTVDARPRFVTDTPPRTAIAGSVYSYGFSASGTPTPTYTLAAGAPGWLSVNRTTGALSGTVPRRTRSFHYSVIASSSDGHAFAGPFGVRVARRPGRSGG